ncbi:MAG: SufS family cysteine desulfurase [Zoogloeaceae bacterium]|jgi:cysteine desulfurase/selenocysteine lyase|nr:SufS family cysteine desulfurase [Zoogloeaceae bacterium]
MSFHPAEWRKHFPLLANDSRLHYLDNAATGQLCEAALDAVTHHELTHRANVLRGTYRLAELADAAYENARRQTAAYLNAASADEVVFTSGATASINLVAHAFGETLGAGDEVALSLAEHHSNFVPWQMLRERRGVTLRFLPLAADGRLDLNRLDEAITPRCRLVAVTHASNVTGAVTDLAPIVAAARAVGARVLADGAQAAQHGPVDVQALGVDFYAFSGHKAFAPTGVGALWGAARALDALPPFLGGGGMIGRVTAAETSYAAPPRRFEAGTPPIAQAVGLGAALDWLHAQSWLALRAHTAQLARRLLDELAALPGLALLGPRDFQARLPVVAFNLDGIHPHDVCQLLDQHGVAVRGGHHCAQPLMDFFGVPGAVRASFAPYNTEADVDALLAGLKDVMKKLR